uniref:Uncharacterized protein n=1 Tax=Parascaris univalens TaxID=6257 RepID=A0A915A2Y3_PARUN
VHDTSTLGTNYMKADYVIIVQCRLVQTPSVDQYSNIGIPTRHCEAFKSGILLLSSGIYFTTEWICNSPPDFAQFRQNDYIRTSAHSLQCSCRVFKLKAF